MRVIYASLALVVVLAGASQALAKPPIIVLPELLGSQLLADYSQAQDPAKACDAAKLAAAKAWPPPIDDLSYFLSTFSPVLPDPTCWYHVMALKNTTQNGTFVSNAGLNVTAALTFASSLTLGPLAAAIRTATGYNTSQITLLPYDWRLDVNSMEKNGAMARMAARIASVSKRAGDKAIIIAHSQGSLVALKLLQMPSVRDAVKGFIALAPPFGGSAGAIAAQTSGSVASVLPAELLAKLQLPPGAPWTREQLLYNAAKGLSGLSMVYPIVAGFPDDPVVVTAGNKTYKVSQLPQMLADIGQTQLSTAYTQLQQVNITGPLPNITTYCIYGSNVSTPRALAYSKGFKSGVVADIPTAAANTTGDQVVALSSLSLCDKLTTADKVARLRAPVNHFTVFSHPTGRAALIKAIKELMK